MLTQLENGFSMDFDLLAKIYAARHERGLPYLSRPSHSELLNRWRNAILDAKLNIDLNNIEASEKVRSKIVNYRRR